MSRWALGLFALGLALVGLSFSPGEARAEAGDELGISLLTFGPGDHPFFKFGHDALLVEDRERHTSVVYNYGTFSFDSVWLIPRFLVGKYRYWLSAEYLERTLPTYARENRSVFAQRLRLTAKQKRDVAEFLAWNAREENKHYLYDYYRDNCATRLRDVIDRATGGALRRASTAPAAMTWREHTMRLTADNHLVYFGLYATMGSFIDRRVTEWEEMFLPAKVAEQIRKTMVETERGPASLVEEEVMLMSAERAPPRSEPPAWTPNMLLFGAIAGLGLCALGWRARRGSRAAGVALGTSVLGLGLSAGLWGCLLVFLWTLTNHEVAYHNENILQLIPVALLLTRPAVDLMRGKPTSARARNLAFGCFACSVLGLSCKALPWFGQNNAQVIALALPIWAGALAALHLTTPQHEGRFPLVRRSASPISSSREDRA